MTRCFLIGAGASYAVGQTMNVTIPTDTRFFETLELIDKVLYNNINRLLKPQFNDIKELKDLTLEYVEDCADKINDKYKTQLNKELKKAVYKLLGVNTRTDDQRVIEHLTRNIGGPNLQLYDLIVENISKGDFFVTLNYDILLELAIMKKTRAIHYGNHFGERHYPVGWGNPVSVYKPHGSLNWDEGGGVTTYVLEPNRIKIATRLSALKDNSLISIWEEAGTNLASADELIIIGSSLSKEDDRLMNFIKAWKMQSRNKNTRTKIINTTSYSKEHNNEVFEGYTGKLSASYDGFHEGSIDFIFD
jgi:hypothetical protein